MAYEIKRHDRRPYFRVQLTQSDPSDPTGATQIPVDLTGASTVDFTMSPAAGSTPKFTNSAGFLVTPASGIVEYRWATGDTDTSGLGWRMEVRVTWSAGVTQTFPSKGYFVLDISDDLDNA